MTSRCPTCKQKLPDDKVLTRICWLCQLPMDRHDKWEYQRLEVDGKVAIVPRHRHCDNPQDYKPRKEKPDVSKQAPV
jgi:predicted amidophosphoribosyltransferase